MWILIWFTIRSPVIVHGRNQNKTTAEWCKEYHRVQYTSRQTEDRYIKYCFVIEIGDQFNAFMELIQSVEDDNVFYRNCGKDDRLERTLVHVHQSTCVLSGNKLQQKLLSQIFIRQREVRKHNGPTINNWYTGPLRLGCYICYSEEGSKREASSSVHSSLYNL